MRFLESNEINEWCHDHAVPINDDWRPIPDSDLPEQRRVDLGGVYQRASSAWREAAAELLTQLGPWNECLLWVTTWGVWASSEDWPLYYALRGAHTERRALAKAPGHLFGSGEDQALLAFLSLAIGFGWDAHILPIPPTGERSIRVFLSHDEYADIHSRHIAASTVQRL